MAEGITTWSDEMDAVRPLDKQQPHSGTWEDRDKVPSRLGEDLIMQEQVEVVARNWQGRRLKPTRRRGRSSGANCRQRPRM